MKPFKPNKLLAKLSAHETYFGRCFVSPKAFSKQILLFVVLFLFNSVTMAQLCEDIFAHGLQSNSSNGRIDFGYQSQLIGNPSTVLSTPSLRVNGGSPSSSCGNTSCSASSQAAASTQVNFPTKFYGNNNFNVSYAQSRVIGEDGNGSFRDININSSASLVFSDKVSTYRIRRLSIGYASRVDLAPGDYWIDQLTLNSQTSINVIGLSLIHI